MTGYFLRHVSIEGWRGINNDGQPLELKFKSEAVNSVFAPNGMGKTSVFDALVFAITGVVPRLKDLPRSEQADNYYCNLFHSSREATIGLRFEPDDGSQEIQIRVRRSPDGVRTVDSPSGHPRPEEFLSQLRGDFVFLDQATFHSFISDSPLDRGRTFSALLGMSEFSSVRQALQMVAHRGNSSTDLGISDLRRSVERAAQEMEEAEARLVQNFPSVTGESIEVDSLDYVLAGQKVTAALGKIPILASLVSDKRLSQIDFSMLRAKVREADNSETRSRLAKLIAQIESLEALKRRDRASAAQWKDLQHLVLGRTRALATTKGPEFERLFETLLAVLRSAAWDDAHRCPACDSPVQRSLVERAELALQEFRDTRDFNRKIEATWKGLGRRQRLRMIEEALSLPASNRKSAEFDQCRATDLNLQTLEDLEAALRALVPQVESRLSELSAERTKIEATLPISLVELITRVENAANVATALKSHYEARTKLDQSSYTLDLRSRWLTFIDNARDIFAKAEINLSRDATDALTLTYEDFYLALTNNAAIRPMLEKAQGSESLHLRLAEFYGEENQSAAALLPESQRNALAIAIFFSAMRKSRSTARFLVLDDITSSFDAGHQAALMELIRTRVARPAETDGPQVIILSHDGLLQKYFDRQNGSQQWHHQVLHGAPPGGPVLTESFAASRLKDTATRLLTSGRVGEAASYIRQYLEERLLTVIRKVNIPVPLEFASRDDRKMVQPCIDAINSAIDLHTRAGSMIIPQTQIRTFQTQAVLVPQIIGNTLNHYSSSSAASIAPAALMGVITTIDTIVECFQYSCTCNGSPTLRFYSSLAKKGTGCQC